jgi:hypothetical protein
LSEKGTAQDVRFIKDMKHDEGKIRAQEQPQEQ